ncbi:FYN-binding protein 2 [Molossus molossus]|uniref:FYN-binding protein 2 n=1 Tax=Molossus molossus TaxID=27622 RepID=UPI0017474BDF|nr:FYN-binding protein 2 [Molossus molossus]
MQASAYRPGLGKAPARRGGGAAFQVGQVRSLDSGVSQAQRSECFLAGAGITEGSLGLRIQLWEAGLVSQTPPQRTTMEGERLRNFKELQAKFQKLDAPSLPGPTKFPAGVSQKGVTGNTQSKMIWANRKPLSSNHDQPQSSCSRGEPQPPEPQKMKLAARSEMQKCSSSPGLLGRSAHSAENSQKALLSDVNQSNAETTNEKNVVSTSFRDKLWNWEKFSSQKSEMSSANCGSRSFHLKGQESLGLTTPEEPRKKLGIKGSLAGPFQRASMALRKSYVASEDVTFLLSQHGKKSLEKSSPERSPAVSIYQPAYGSELATQGLDYLCSEKRPNVRRHQLPKPKPLPPAESLGPPPAKPQKPPAGTLQASQRGTAAVPQAHRQAAVEEGYLHPERAEFEEPHNYEATISYLRLSGNPINLRTAKEIADSTYEVGIEEVQKPWKSCLHQELSPKYEDKKMKNREPRELELQKTEKDLHADHPFKVGSYEGTPGKVPMTKVHRHVERTPPRKPDAVIDRIQTKTCLKDPKLTRHFQGQCGDVEALQVTKRIPGPRTFKPSEIYDDVECPGRKELKWDFSSNSFASDSEENSKEMYEDVYKAKSSGTETDFDGKALKKLQRFFKKEKDRLKMTKTKLKENLSSILIYLLKNIFLLRDEVKEKNWRPKFFKPKEKKESESPSPRNFFRTKKQSLEKNKMQREKLFREVFEYDREITVINTAVACSRNSRNGIFDLPITPGEKLEVIDTTEENLVICRNSKGKYGFVLIEHLHFKPQGWST